MILLDRIYIKCIKFCVKFCVEISQIPNFNAEHSDMPICKALRMGHV